MNKGFSCLIALSVLAGAISSFCVTGGKERFLIECWLKENSLNPYGDPMDTVYAGGTPLFDETTGMYLDPDEYLYQKYPDKPWDTAQAKASFDALKEGEQRAEKSIKSFVDKSLISDVAKAIQYLKYYKSWYQSVTPAPASLRESLSRQALNFVNNIKQYADEHFVFKQELLPGMSTLNCFGEAYFTHIKDLLSNQFVYKVVLHAKRDLSPIIKNVSIEDLKKLGKYLAYYRSWYQAVTPAPRELVESLTDKAKDMLAHIKEAADTHFTQEPAQKIAGASRLSLYGTKYYDQINAWISHQIDLKEKQVIGSQRMMARKVVRC